MALADDQKNLAAHCGPGNYTVVQQGEEAIGVDVITRSDTQYGEDTVAGGASSTRGGASTSGIQSTRTATEWRLHYVCGAPGASAGGPPPPPAPPPY
jgi:hypothetical protein